MDIIGTLLKYTVAGAMNGFFFTVGSLTAKELAKKAGFYEDEAKPEVAAETPKAPTGPEL